MGTSRTNAPRDCSTRNKETSWYGKMNSPVTNHSIGPASITLEAAVSIHTPSSWKTRQTSFDVPPSILLIVSNVAEAAVISSIAIRVGAITPIEAVSSIIDAVIALAVEP